MLPACSAKKLDKQSWVNFSMHIRVVLHVNSSIMILIPVLGSLAIDQYVPEGLYGEIYPSLGGKISIIQQME